MGLTKSNLFTDSQNELAIIAKALAHPARIAIVEHLIKANACINNDLVNETGLAQATVSQHLKELKAVGIIQGSIEGVSMSYCIDKKRWKEISESLSLLFGRIDTAIGNCC